MDRAPRVATASLSVALSPWGFRIPGLEQRKENRKGIIPCSDLEPSQEHGCTDTSYLHPESVAVSGGDGCLACSGLTCSRQPTAFRVWESRTRFFRRCLCRRL